MRVAALLASLLLLPACGSDIQTGSMSEFCDDWAALDARYEGFDPETIDDVSAMVDAMAKDVRWPRTMQDDAEEAVEEMRTLIEEMDGVDINSAEAQDIADRADVDAFKRVGDFGDDSC